MKAPTRRIDLDEFDLYYDHLFLWDREKKRLVGAYRIGDGKRIMSRYGKRGFYTSTLFRMDRPMERVLRRSFELGRSFISVDYQRQRLPLYMLWRGLLLHVTANPDQQYLIGPVSISGTYSRFSRALIMEFVQQNHYDQEMAASVRPRNKFKIKPDKSDSEALVEASMADLKKMDRLIAEVDPNETAMPVLLKKYLLLNARIIGFNRDPRFNDALDGLMVLDLTKLPERTMEDLRKGMAELTDTDMSSRFVRVGRRSGTRTIGSPWCIMERPTLVLGASTIHARYAHRAAERLLDTGHPVLLPVSESGEQVGGHQSDQNTCGSRDGHHYPVRLSRWIQEQWHQRILSFRARSASSSIPGDGACRVRRSVRPIRASRWWKDAPWSCWPRVSTERVRHAKKPPKEFRGAFEEEAA